MKNTVKIRIREAYAESSTRSEIYEQLESIVFDTLRNNREENEIEESEDLGQMVFTLVIYMHINQVIQTFAPLCGPGSFYYILSLNSDVD